MPLTDVRIRQAKPAEKSYKLTDGNGLFIEVRPNGSKLWRYQYRIAGKPNLFALGAYPEVALQDARQEHAKARALVKQGIHPAHERARTRAEQVASNLDTFQVVADEWIEQKRTKGSRKGWSPYYEKQVRSYFERDVYPKIGRRPMRSITSAEVLSILRAIADRGATSAAILVRQWISSVFVHGVRTLRADADPAAVLKGAIIRPKVQHAEAKDRDELRDLMARIRNYGGNRTTAIALRLLMMLFLRTGELRRSPWSEVEPAIESGLWTVPAERMKMRRKHLVPLPRQAIALLKELHDITGANAHLFPNTRRPKDVMTATTVNRALEHMGYPSGFFTGHDFRATASTLLHEMGYRTEVVEMQMAHAKRDKVGAIYNHAQYLPERTEMMQAWADWLEKAEADEAPIKRRAASTDQPRRSQRRRAA